MMIKTCIRTLVITAVAVLIADSGFAKEPETVVPHRPNQWWLDRHEQKMKEVAENRDAIELVFIGDSITHFMDDRAPGILKENFPGVTTLNLGYSADRTENVLWRVTNGEIDGINPKLFVIMIGTNNTGHRRDPAKDTAMGIDLIVKTIRSKCPESKVLLLSIFPRGAEANHELRKLNGEINALMPAMVDGKKIFHLDINQKFLDADGVLSKTIMSDLLHPNKKGYEIWIDAVKPTVDKLMAL